MTNKKNLICIVCPVGCNLMVCMEEARKITVSGNHCMRGKIYAEEECTNPTRILTTTVRVMEGEAPLISVKSDKPLPKDMLLDCMKVINKIRITAPVSINEIVHKNILDTGINIIATRNIKRKNVI